MKNCLSKKRKKHAKKSELTLKPKKKKGHHRSVSDTANLIDFTYHFTQGSGVSNVPTSSQSIHHDLITSQKVFNYQKPGSKKVQ